MQYVEVAKEKRRKTETAAKFGEYLQLCGGICRHSVLLLCSLAEAEAASMEDMVRVCVGEEGEEESAARGGPVGRNQNSEVRGLNRSYSS